MPSTGKYPLEVDYTELKKNMNSAFIYFNSPAGTPNINLVGNDIKTLEDLKNQVIAIATASQNKITVDLASQLPSTSESYPAFAEVVNDTDENNGNWWKPDAGSAWEKTTLQPITEAQLTELIEYIDSQIILTKEYADQQDELVRQYAVEQDNLVRKYVKDLDAAASRRTPQESLFGEFYNDDNLAMPDFGIIDAEGNWGVVVNKNGIVNLENQPQYEFYNDDQDIAPHVEITSDGFIIAAWDENGVPIEIVDVPLYEFFNDDQDIAPHVVIATDRLILYGWDENGQPFNNELLLYEFYNDDQDIDSRVMIALDGTLMFAWDEDGNQTYPDVVAPLPETYEQLMAYVEAGILHSVGQVDTIVANLNDVEVLAVAPGTDKYVRAVIRGPRTGGVAQIIKAGPELQGRAVPSEDVVEGGASIGQSLSVGARSGATLVSTPPILPDQVQMPDVGPDSDVRMGINSNSEATITPLDPNAFVGFIPMVAKPGIGGGGGAGRGETPLEATCNNIALRANLLGIKKTVMGFVAGAGGTGYSGLKKGTQSYENLLIAAEKSAELYAQQNKRYALRALFLKHGEANQNSGVTYYKDALFEWQNDFDGDIKARTGQPEDVHFLMHQPSSHSSYNPLTGQGAYATIDMVNAHKESIYHHLVGPDYPYMEFFADDILHFLGQGYFLIGEDNADHYEEVFWMGQKSQVLIIDSVTRVNATTFDLSYKVPVAPLVFDTTSVSERDVKGYTIHGSDGVPISITATIMDDGLNDGTAIVRLVCATEPPSGNVYIGYAMSPNGSGSGREMALVPRGNVRDSKSVISRLDGRSRHNWAHHQRVVVQS